MCVGLLHALPAGSGHVHVEVVEFVVVEVVEVVADVYFSKPMRLLHIFIFLSR